MKKLISLFAVLLSSPVFAASSFYFVSSFNGPAQDLIANTLVLCGQPGDFAAEEYCYPVLLGKTKFALNNEGLLLAQVVQLGETQLVVGKTTGKISKINLGPNGTGTLTQVFVKDISTKKKRSPKANRGANGEPLWPPVISGFDGIEFKLTLKNKVLDSGIAPSGFYQQY